MRLAAPLISLLLLGAGPGPARAEPPLLREARASLASLGVDVAALPAAESGPVEVLLDPMSGDRLKDVGLALAVVVGLFLLGRFLKSAGLKIHPAVFASAALGLLAFTMVNSAFWELKGVRIDASGLSELRQVGSDVELPWSKVRVVESSAGSAFPFFLDDRALLLSDGGDRTVRILRGLTDAPKAYAAVLAHLSVPPPKAPAAPSATKKAP